MMSSQPPENSTDLEWMLQSGQASPRILAEALVEAAYAPAYRLALSLLDDEAAARQAVKESFLAALARAARSRGPAEIQTWLFRLVLDACYRSRSRARRRRPFEPFLDRREKPYAFGAAVPQDDLDVALWRAADGLEGQARLPALLYFVHGWGIPESARLLGKTESEVSAGLDRARSQFALAAGGEDPIPGGAQPETEALDTPVRRSLQRRWPSLAVRPEEAKRLAAEIEAEAGRQGARQRRSVSLNEALWICIVALLAIGLVWASNRLLPEPQAARPPAPAQPREPKIYQEQIDDKAASPPPAFTPAPVPSQGGEPEGAATHSAWIYYSIEPGETLHEIAMRFGISEEELARHNRLDPGAALQPYTALEVPLPQTASEAITPPPVKSALYPLEPLDGQASPQEIYPYLLSSSRLWRTLWADAQFFSYGPQGYIGPSLAARTQVWVSQPGLSNQLVGRLDGQPYYHTVIRDGYRYSSTRYGSTGWLEDTGENIQLSLLDALIFPDRFEQVLQQGELRVVGDDRMAERSTVVVDWIDDEGRRGWRLWIDSEKAVILRSQKFDVEDGETLLEEIVLTSIGFDQEFPGQVFDPLTTWTGYAVDATGQPAPSDAPAPPPALSPSAFRRSLLLQEAPPGFDPARSSLEFQYPSGSSIEPPSARSSPVVQVFAGGWFLGSVQFASPWGLLCDRSPNGRRIAFAPEGNWLEFSSFWEPPQVRWFDLEDVSRVHTLPVPLEATDFAFAPDSRRIAVAGFEAPGGPEPEAGVYVFDLDRGEHRRILTLKGSGSSLVWSPDGNYLGFLGSTEPWQQDSLIVDVKSGKILYRTPIDPEIFRDWPAQPGARAAPSPDWPAHTWGVEFPVFRRDLGACAKAPE